jgi:hypothetical protein
MTQNELAERDAEIVRLKAAIHSMAESAAKRSVELQETKAILRAWLDWRANKSTEDLDAIAERARKAVGR